MLEKYAPELLFGFMAMVMNIVLIVACAWTTVRLFQISNSWHSLWALLMLLAMHSYKFIRD